MGDGGAGRTVLAVTATDREAEDSGAAVADLLGTDAVAVLPSWETLPHERLSPRPDTVGPPPDDLPPARRRRRRPRGWWSRRHAA